jgi:hypothetical protein
LETRVLLDDDLGWGGGGLAEVVLASMSFKHCISLPRLHCLHCLRRFRRRKAMLGLGLFASIPETASRAFLAASLSTFFQRLS